VLGPHERTFGTPGGELDVLAGFTAILRHFTALDSADMAVACTRRMVAPDSGRRAAAVSVRASTSGRSIGEGRPSDGRPICRMAA
jgi:hypothetical protein